MLPRILAQPVDGAIEPARHVPPGRRVVVSPLTPHTILEFSNPSDQPARFVVLGARPDNYGYLHDETYELAPGDVRLVRFPVPAFFQANEYADVLIDVDSGIDMGAMAFPLAFKRAMLGVFQA